MNTLTDPEFEAHKNSLNNAIHELVFAVQHMEQDDLDDACTCLVTATGNIERVAEALAKKEAA